MEGSYELNVVCGMANACSCALVPLDPLNSGAPLHSSHRDL